MDEQRFDALIKTLGAQSRRRVVLGLVAGALLRGLGVADVSGKPGRTRAAGAHGRRGRGARAGTGNGAQVGGGPIAIDECGTLCPGGDPCDGRYSVCYQAKGESHATETPSGIAFYEINLQYERFTELYYGVVVHSTTSEDVHLSDHYKQDEEFVVHRASHTIEILGPYYGHTCTMDVRMHFANGTYQYSDEVQECHRNCTDCPPPPE